MKRRIIIFICLLCLVLVEFGTQLKPVAAAGNTSYVSTSGSDSANGSLSTPWKTINHAANTAVGGDTVNIETGTYNEEVTFANSGTAGNPITFQNYNGETVILDGTGLTYSGVCGLLQMVNKSYITISGLTIQNCKGTGSQDISGIYAVGTCTYLTFQNLIIHDTGIDGIWAGTSFGPFSSNTMTNLTINGCTIYNTNYYADQEGVSLVGVTGFTIENSIIHNTALSIGFDAKVGCQNGSMHNNTAYSCTSAPGFYVDCGGVNTSNISIYDNISYNNAEGIQLGDEKGIATMSNIDIYNNILYDNGEDGLEVDSDSPNTESFNFTFINNTLYSDSIVNDAFEILLGGTHVNYSGCVIRNNLIYGTVSGIDCIDYSDYANGGVTIDHNDYYMSSGSWVSGTTLGTNNITSNPELVSPTTNFDLQSISLCINAGSATGAPATDFIGTSRPQGSAYDIGAYEYQIASPAVTSGAASVITATGATLNGSLTVLGSSSPVTVSFDWGTDTSYSGGNIIATPSSVASVPTTFTAGLSGLTAGTTYHYRAKAVGATTVYGNDQNFTTSTLPSALTVTSTSLPNGTIGVAYSQTLAATGGTSPYTWAITSGSLPAGFSLSTSGIISGTPTTTGGPNTITFQVTDSTGATAIKSLPITINASPSITTSSLPKPTRKSLTGAITSYTR